MNLTEKEYREFLSTFGSFLNKQKQWVNKVVLQDGKGLHMPMADDEIKVQLSFIDGAMHIFLEIYKNAGKWLEEEWWDDDHKDRMHIPEHDSADWDWKDGETWDGRHEENEENYTDKERGP